VITIRQVTGDDWRTWRELRLHALREAPDAFSSTLAEWEMADEARWRSRLHDVSYNVLADLDQLRAGMASGSRAAGDVEVMSLWVAPFARGLGVGDAPTRSWTR
jgi:hypothetical protein